MHVGRVLAERYELLRPIAEGGSGEVWAARDSVSGDEVAIKAVSLDRAGWRAEVRDRFLLESRILRLVHDEHLVGVRDAGETEDGYLYSVLDLLEGDTLADRIAREGRLPAREARDLAHGIALGLGVLHARGIVHRDLKPANVVLHREDGRLVPTIIDLGVSKVRVAAADPMFQATLTATGQVLGTPQYMSYEQALGEPDVDARSDVWALGVVLYEMLAGRPPFVAANVNAVLAAIRREAPPPLAELAPDAPEALVVIVERCLARDRDARYRDGGEVAAALESALADDDPPSSRTVTRAAMIAPSTARSRGRGAAWLVIAAAVGAALLVLGARTYRPEASGSAVRAPGAARAAMIAPPPTPSVTPSASPSESASAASAAPSASAVLTPAAAVRVAPSARPPSRADGASACPAASTRAPVTRVVDAGF